MYEMAVLELDLLDFKIRLKSLNLNLAATKRGETKRKTIDNHDVFN